jgi:serine/threonine protein kinase
MGVVYKARHVALDRIAALKMVLGTAQADSREIIRFLAEAGAVAAVRHEHVVGVYEFGEADGRPFLALEYLPGGTLTARLKAVGRFDPRAAAVLVEKLARGVGSYSLALPEPEGHTGSNPEPSRCQPTRLRLLHSIRMEPIRTQMRTRPELKMKESASGLCRPTRPPAI